MANRLKKLREEIKLLERQKELLETIVELKKLADEYNKSHPQTIPYPAPYPIYPQPYNPWEPYTWISTGTQYELGCSGNSCTLTGGDDG